MPDRPVCVLVDPTTYAILQKNDAEIFNLAEVLSIEVPADLTQAEKSRYLKVTCRQWIRGDILFIDTDTVICRPFPDKVSDKPLGFVLDSNLPFSQCAPVQQRRMYDFLSIFNISEPRENYYNSGVIWAADNATAKMFFKAWKEKWQETRMCGKHFDQPALNTMLDDFEDDIEPLEAIWNLQISFETITPINYLSRALILHYFNDINSPYLLCDPEIKRQRYDSEIIKNIIDNPTGAFAKCMLFHLNEENEQFINSRQYSLLKDIIFVKHKKLFAMNEKILGFLGKLRRK